MDILDEITALVNERRDRMSGAADKLRDDRQFPETAGSNGLRYGECDDVPQSGPLAQIAKMIDQHTIAAREIGYKLDAHADRVYGLVPQEADNDMRGAPERSTIPALERIFIALGDLDRAMSAMAQAAGRNSTLA